MENTDPKIIKSENNTHRTAAILNAVRSVNKILFHADSKHEIIHSACNILVETHGFNTVWIALFDDDKRMEGFASAGFTSNLTDLKYKLERGNLPKCLEQTLSKSKLKVVSSPVDECPDCPIAEKYAEWSIFVSPLTHNNKLFGSISASVSREFANSPDEQEIFTELARDIAFTIDKLTVEKKMDETAAMLKEKTDSYQHLAGAIFASMSIVKQDGTFLFANAKSAANMTGQTPPPDIAGKNIKDFLPKENAEAFIIQYKKVIETNELLKQEVDIETKNGHKYFMNTLRPITYQQEKERVVLSVSMDITDLRKSQIALRESEEKYRFLAESTFEGIIVHKNGIVIDVNDAFVKITGYTKKEAIGQNLLDYLSSKADVAKVLLNIVKFRARPYTITGRCKDGNTFVAELEAKNVKHQGKTVRIVALRDVTEKMQAAEKIKRSEEKYKKNNALFRQLNDTMPDMVWAKDLDYKYIFANKAICKNLLNANDINEPIGKTDLFFALRERNTHPENANWHTFGELCQDSDAITIKELKKMQFDEYGNVRGKFLFLDVHKAPLFDDDGKLIGIVGSARDVTPNKEAEKILIAKNKELIMAKEKAEESDRLKSAFLTNMSHEIRTPMNGILGFTSLLKEPELTGNEQEKYIQLIQKSGDRMLSTINDLIDIAKIESGQETLRLTPVDIYQLLRDLYDFFLPEAQAKGLDLILDCSEKAEGLSQLSDADKLSSIMTNLIKNAIKFTRQGSISFGLKKTEENLELFVRDTGIGIPMDRQKAIFERFVQADISDSRAFEGSGLGLSITKSYIEMMGGTIKLVSEQGKGSGFYVRIPDQLESPRPKTDYRKEDSFEHVNLKGKLKILIAEDDETSMFFLKLILKKMTHKIIAVSTGVDAVEAVRNNPDIDLILMDIKMPLMGGLEATERIRKFNQEIIIIAQTAYAQSNDSKTALQAGCNDYIAKPIDRDSLLKMIRQWVR